MNIIACFGPMMGTEDAIIILGIALAIAGILAGGAAVVISQVFKIRMRQALGVEAIALLVCGLVTAPLGWEGTAMLTLSGAFVSGCLFVLGRLFRWIRGERTKQDFCSLELTDRSTVEAAK
jgi:hypothetical protein